MEHNPYLLKNQLANAIQVLRPDVSIGRNSGREISSKPIGYKYFPSLSSAHYYGCS
jgi:hypothetical protein